VASRRSAGRVTRIASTSGDGAPSDARIVINEVLYDAAGSGTDGDLEWVELYNGTDVDVDLVGWSLMDGASGDVLPTLVIPARGFAIVAATDAFFGAYPDFTGALAMLGGRPGNGLGNDGDALFLLDPSGRAVDAVSWGDNAFALDPAVGDVPEGHSIEREVAGRDSDTASDWIDNESPSPGMAYAAASVDSGSNGAASTVEVIEGAGERSWGWLAWVMVAASGAVLAGAVLWRTFESVCGRLRQQP
jgi:hypothetical protein